MLIVCPLGGGKLRGGGDSEDISLNAVAFSKKDSKRVFRWREDVDGVLWMWTVSPVPPAPV